MQTFLYSDANENMAVIVAVNIEQAFTVAEQKYKDMTGWTLTNLSAMKTVAIFEVVPKK